MMKENISFLEFEAVQARSERKEKRLLITLMIIVGLLFASNMVWLWLFIGGFLR